MKKVWKLVVSLAAIGAIVGGVKKWLGGKPTPLQEEEQPSTAGGQMEEQPADETFDESELGGEVDPELLKILVDPGDKGPLELSEDGKWLINPRNGYRYPIRRGIPVMLLEEGEKHRDPSLIREVPAEESSVQEQETPPTAGE